MDIVLLVLKIGLVIVAVLMTFFILLQEGKGGGLTGLGGTKAAGVEGVTNPIRRATAYLAVIFFSLAILLGFLTHSQQRNLTGSNTLAEEGSAMKGSGDNEKPDAAKPPLELPPLPVPPAPALKTDEKTGAPAEAKTAESKAGESKTVELKTEETKSGVEVVIPIPPEVKTPAVETPKTGAPKVEGEKTGDAKTGEPGKTLAPETK